jgi:hypothetical protein
MSFDRTYRLAILGLMTAGLLSLAGCPSPDAGGGPGDDAPDAPDGDGPNTPGGADPDDADTKAVGLFVMGPNMGLVGFGRVEALDGENVDVTTELATGPDTILTPRDAVIDRRGALYVLSGARGGSVAVYDNPLTANGGRRPDRVVYGEATGISRSPTGLAIDDENDLLYVSNLLEGVVVFDISSPDAFDGEVAPVRAFEIDYPMFQAAQVRFANGSLYVADVRGATTDILAFDQPQSLDGLVAPDRVISSTGFDDRIGFSIDPLDRLLVGARENGLVLMFENAAALDGAVTPDLTLTIAGADVEPWTSFATSDSDDRLFVADANGARIYVFDELTDLASGAREADRIIDSSELLVPDRLIVFER